MDKEAAARHFVLLNLSEAEGRARPQLVARLAARSLAAVRPARAVAAQAAALAGARPVAPAPGLPALVVHGSEDAVLDAAEGRHLARLWRAELLELPGAGHVPFWTAMGPCTRAVRAFLLRLDDGPPKAKL